MPEGATTWPTDSAGLKGMGLFDGTNFWFWRGDPTHQHAGVTLYDSAGAAIASTPGNIDGNSVSPNGLLVVNEALDFNEASWDRHRGNVDRILLASAARTASASSAIQTNYNHRGVIVVINVTAIGSVSLTPSIRGLDPVTLSTYTLYGGLGGIGMAMEPAITATGLFALILYPGAGSANAGLTSTSTIAAVPTAVPRSWQVFINHSNANSATYSVGASLIL